MTVARRVRLCGEAIEKRFGRVAALRGVDFEIEPGESVAILGANGAGKSSLLRILAGLSRPSAGRLTGYACDSDKKTRTGRGTGDGLSREALRATIGYVGHATLLYGELTARENLRFSARLQGQRPSAEELDRVLDGFALLDVADRRAGTFSRGMAQRLSIARAVVHDPHVLLLDEPFTGLDEVSGENLATRLAEQNAQGRTLVVVTHDPRRAVSLAERALVLHRGEIRGRPGAAAPGSQAAGNSEVDFEVDSLRDNLSRLAREEFPQTQASLGIPS